MFFWPSQFIYMCYTLTQNQKENLVGVLKYTIFVSYRMKYMYENEHINALSVHFKSWKLEDEKSSRKIPQL